MVRLLSSESFIARDELLHFHLGGVQFWIDADLQYRLLSFGRYCLFIFRRHAAGMRSFTHVCGQGIAELLPSLSDQMLMAFGILLASLWRTSLLVLYIVGKCGKVNFARRHFTRNVPSRHDLYRGQRKAKWHYHVGVFPIAMEVGQRHNLFLADGLFVLRDCRVVNGITALIFDAGSRADFRFLDFVFSYRVADPTGRFRFTTTEKELQLGRGQHRFRESVVILFILRFTLCSLNEFESVLASLGLGFVERREPVQRMNLIHDHPTRMGLAPFR